MLVEAVPRSAVALDALTLAITDEYAKLDSSVVATIERAIVCGTLLTEAKKRVPHGRWESWLLENFPERSLKTHRLYMRVAANADEVRRVGPASLHDAHRLLAGKRRTNAPIADRRDEAIRLVSEGMAYRDVAKRLGVSHNAVYEWMNPEVVDRRREQRGSQSHTARREATRATRAEQVAAFGGGVDDAYRKVAAAIRSLNEAVELGEVSEAGKGAIQLACTKLAQAEDEIVRAVRAGAP